MPLIRFPTVKGLVYTIDLSKIADRENPRTVEAPISSTTGFTGSYTVDWGDGITETFTTATYPTHTYAAGAGDIFRVVVRVAGGKLPPIRALRANSASEATNPQYNITWGIVSLDHFGGDIYSDTLSGSALFRGCKNLTYIDPRYIGLYKLTTLSDMARGCNSLSMPVESLCFDFVTLASSIANSFSGGAIYGAMPETMFDNCVSITNVSQAFRACPRLTAPYEFWNASYAANITNSANCYEGCSGMDLNQVPTAYGGTMTV